LIFLRNEHSYESYPNGHESIKKSRIIWVAQRKIVSLQPVNILKDKATAAFQKVPRTAIQINLIGIKTAACSRLQYGGVGIGSSSPKRFATVGTVL
jgi:hypothetical protein